MFPNNNGEGNGDNVNECESEVTMHAWGSYPFLPSPNIEFRVVWNLKVIRTNRVRITLSGGHNLFPNFEGLLDGSDLYEYPTLLPGPTVSDLEASTSFPRQTREIDAETRGCCHEE
jgi:hypothetical protein